MDLNNLQPTLAYSEIEQHVRQVASAKTVLNDFAIDEGAENIRKTKFRGVSITEFDRDELLTMLAYAARLQNLNFREFGREIPPRHAPRVQIDRDYTGATVKK